MTSLKEIAMKLKTTLAVAALLTLTSAGAFAADPTRGKTLYATCGACHGANAEGMEALNSPKLAGQEEWYIIRQLQNFKAGIRGNNPRDTYGLQMAPMAQLLADDAAMADVAAYIKTLTP
jgi:cytochrome c oxidase subunit 2